MIAAGLVAAALATVSVDADRPIGRGDVPAQLRAPGFAGEVEIRTRGRWSQRFPKKSYAVEIRERRGWRLAARAPGRGRLDPLRRLQRPHADPQRARVRDGATGWAATPPRTRFVELRLNGRHHGVYVLMEKLELGRVHGDFLLEMTSPRPGAAQGPLVPHPARAGRWCGPIQSATTCGAAERSPSATASRGPSARCIAAGAWRRHLHAGAAVDYLLVNELFKNQDAMEASTFITGAGGRLRLGPVWDFDFSSGNSQRAPSRFLHGWMAAERPWAERLYADRAFRRQMARRWAQLRRERAAGLAAALGRRARPRAGPAARRDSARWRAGGDRPRGPTPGTRASCGPGSIAGSTGWTATCDRPRRPRPAPGHRPRRGRRARLRALPSAPPAHGPRGRLRPLQRRRLPRPRR